MNNILTGAAMGAALTTAGVYAPDIILSQFKFTDFTMLQTFLTAAAGSSYANSPFLPLSPLLPSALSAHKHTHGNNPSRPSTKRKPSIQPNLF